MISYRFKYGPAKATECSEEAGYSAEQARQQQQIHIDHHSLEDGPIVLCVVGRNAEGEQKLTEAAKAIWELDRTGPSSFSIKEFNADKRLIAWSAPEKNDAAYYSLAIVPSRRDCSQPVYQVRLTELSKKIEQDLAGGRYKICLHAYDDLGNATMASNADAFHLEVPVNIHLAYLRGLGPSERALVYSLRQGSETWQPSSPASHGEFDSIGLVQVDAKGQPFVAYSSLDRSINKPGSYVNVARREANTNWKTSALLDSSSQPLSAGEGVTLHLDEQQRIHIAQFQMVADKKHLVHLATSPGSDAVSQKQEVEVTNAAKDLSMTTDSKGTLHLSYADLNHVYYLQQTGDQPLSGLYPLPTEGCSNIDLTKLVISPKGKVLVAFLCSKEAQAPATAASCVVKLGESEAVMPGQWQVHELAVVDPAHECLPFKGNRPAIAIDGLGRVHMAYRYTDAQHPDQWDIAYIVSEGGPSGRFLPPKMMGNWDLLTGHPAIAIDATDRAHLAWLSVGSSIRYAFGYATDPWGASTIVVAPPTDIASAKVIELGGLVIVGAKN